MDLRKTSRTHLIRTHLTRKPAVRAALGLAALVTVGGVVFAACSTEVEHGTVIEKQHIRADWTWVTVPRSNTICSGFKSHRSCRTTTSYHTASVYRPECWELVLRDKDGDTGTICVSAREYGNLKVGDKR